jgi:hypothetical protein
MDFAHAYDPIRALRSAWKLLGRAPLAFLACGALLLLVQVGFAIAFPLTFAEHRHLHRISVIALLGFFGSVSAVAYLVGCWLSLGLAQAVEKSVVTGTARPGDLFETRDRYFEMVFGGAVVFLVSLLALLPFVAIALVATFLHERVRVPVPLVAFGGFISAAAYLMVYLYVLLGVSLWRQAIAIEGLGPVAALGRSWRLANGHRLRLALYWLVMSLVTFVGFWGGLMLFCCGVIPGLVLSVTLAQIAQFESYFALVRADDHARSWIAGGAPVPPSPPLNATIG